MWFENITYDNFVEISPGSGKAEISILFPIYQREQYVRESLESALSQRNVTAEIIISDDASEDNSFKIAIDTVLQWLGNNSCSHRILVRRGSSRLRRDHIHLMVEKAECDIVCQFHDDDISHPDRTLLTINAFKLFPKMTMMGIECDYINEYGIPLGIENSFSDPIVLDVLHIEEIIAPANQYLVGACQAWKKSSSQLFDKLHSTYAPVGHDWIQAFRCALAGEVRLVRAPLIKRRTHIKSWSSNMVSSETNASKNFGWRLQYFSCQISIRKDLRKALEIGLITNETYLDRLKTIENVQNATVELMMCAYQELTHEGKIPYWI